MSDEAISPQRKHRAVEQIYGKWEKRRLVLGKLNLRCL